MLTFEQITELVKLVAEHRLRGVEIERSGFRLKVDGQRTEPTVVTTGAGVPYAPPAAAPAAPPAATAPPPAEEADELAGAYILQSPIVGTFYAASSPEAAPYAQVGARVTKGQVLCIVEAMKLMNEIESDADGVVEKIFPKNAQPVEYGEPLFAIRPD